MESGLVWALGRMGGESERLSGGSAVRVAAVEAEPEEEEEVGGI